MRARRTLPPRDRIFGSLAHTRYRRYLAAQAGSQVGAWMQTIAQSWLVLRLTGSGSMVGLTLALQSLPMLLLAPLFGVLADRRDRRRLLLASQALSAILALTLGLLTALDAVRLWEVLGIALGAGLSNSLDSPVRQSLLSDLVPPEDLRNAVSLYSVMSNAARLVGPALAGATIGGLGLGSCFLVNAVSYLPLLVVLGRLRMPPGLPAEESGGVRAGLRYARRTAAVRRPILMMAIIGCLAYEFPVTLPVLARTGFGGDVQTYAVLTMALGLGSLCGGLWVAGYGAVGRRALRRSALGLGVALAATAAAPTLGLAVAALAVTGAASVWFSAQANSSLQLAAAPGMRGRVLALWAVANVGSTPLGAPVVGVVGDHLGPRAGIALGAVGCGLAALVVARPAGQPTAGSRDSAGRPSRRRSSARKASTSASSTSNAHIQRTTPSRRSQS